MMNKIIISILFLFLFSASYAQFPNSGWTGNLNTEQYDSGARGAYIGFHLRKGWVDTASLNSYSTGFLKNIDGFLVRVGHNLYMRNVLTNTWDKINGSNGGGSTNSNIGTGFRWAVPNTNNVKTIFPSWAIIIDSTSNTNALTVQVDSNKIKQIAGVYDATVDFSVNTNPNTVGTTFNPNTPSLTTVIYVSVIDGGQWTYNGSSYVIYRAPYWSLQGNAYTNHTNDFIGTTDNVPLSIRVNNEFAGIIDYENANTALGKNSYSTAYTGVLNTVIGSQSGLQLTTGGQNTIVGATGKTSDGDFNTLVGSGVMSNSLTSSDGNTAIGYWSLFKANSNKNIGIGYGAGSNATTAGNELFIDNKLNSTYFRDTTRAIIYGKMGADSSAQRLRINAKLQVTNVPTGAGVYSARFDALGNLLKTDTTIASTQTLQTVTNAGFVTTNPIAAAYYEATDSSQGYIFDYPFSPFPFTTNLKVNPLASSNLNVYMPNGSGTLALQSDITGGTVTNVSALTLGTTGTDLSSSVTNGTTTPVITLNVPTASASNRGVLSSTDWSAFNNKQSTVSFGAIGASPNANGGSISSGVITLQPASASFGGLVTTGSQTFAGNKTFGNANWTGLLANTGFNTTSYQLQFGSFLGQPYSLNNGFISENAYFNGSSWMRNATGYAGGFQFYNGQVLIHNINTGTGAFTQAVQMKVDYTGAFGLGVSIASAPNDYTGANFYHSASGSIGIGTTTPDASAILDVQSTTQGVLLTRMTTTQRTSISSPVEGLEVYDLTLHKKYVYDGTTWQACW